MRDFAYRTKGELSHVTNIVTYIYIYIYILFNWVQISTNAARIRASPTKYAGTGLDHISVRENCSVETDIGQSEDVAKVRVYRVT